MDFRKLGYTINTDNLERPCIAINDELPLATALEIIIEVSQDPRVRNIELIPSVLPGQVMLYIGFTDAATAALAASSLLPGPSTDPFSDGPRTPDAVAVADKDPLAWIKDDDND